jgi:ketosteroid isomerase-like protein
MPWQVPSAIKPFDTILQNCDTRASGIPPGEFFMKATLAMCLLLLSCTLPAARSATNNADADREKLLALENAWNQAQLHHDAAAVGQLLPETFIYTDYDGTVMNKAKFLADVKDINYRATSISNEEMNVVPYRNVAIVIGTYHSKGTYKGKAFNHRGRFTDTWIFHDGNWQCVASHTSLIGKG